LQDLQISRFHVHRSFFLSIVEGQFPFFVANSNAIYKKRFFCYHLLTGFLHSLYRWFSTFMPLPWKASAAAASCSVRLFTFPLQRDYPVFDIDIYVFTLNEWIIHDQVCDLPFYLLIDLPVCITFVLIIFATGEYLVYFWRGFWKRKAAPNVGEVIQFVFFWCESPFPKDKKSLIIEYIPPSKGKDSLWKIRKQIENKSSSKTML
jgi:hypothetical protein